MYLPIFVSLVFFFVIFLCVVVWSWTCLAWVIVQSICNLCWTFCDDLELNYLWLSATHSLNLIYARNVRVNFGSTLWALFPLLVISFIWLQSCSSIIANALVHQLWTTKQRKTTTQLSYLHAWIPNWMSARNSGIGTKKKVTRNAQIDGARIHICNILS